MNLQEAKTLGLKYITSEKILAKYNLKYALDEDLRKELLAKYQKYLKAERLLIEDMKNTGEPNG